MFNQEVFRNSRKVIWKARKWIREQPIYLLTHTFDRPLNFLCCHIDSDMLTWRSFFCLKTFDCSKTHAQYGVNNVFCNSELPRFIDICPLLDQMRPFLNQLFISMFDTSLNLYIFYYNNLSHKIFNLCLYCLSLVTRDIDLIMLSQIMLRIVWNQVIWQTTQIQT